MLIRMMMKLTPAMTIPAISPPFKELALVEFMATIADANFAISDLFCDKKSNDSKISTQFQE